MYAARVPMERAKIVAIAVQDERQLDGSWHLELVGETEESTMAVSLRIVLDREGALVEGELGVSQRDDEQLGEIEADAVADELEPLAIEFAAELENGRASVSVAQRDDGDFDLELDFGAAR